MMDSGYNVLDTRVIDNFLGKRAELMEEYDAINQEYKCIVSDLCHIWKGEGANAFERDAEKIAQNITGLRDVLQTACDMADDIKKLFAEEDTKLGNVNRELL